MPEEQAMPVVELEEASVGLSKIVSAAEKGEPTTICRNGKPVAIIVSHAAWQRLTSPSFAELLLAMPSLDEVDLSRKPARVLRETDWLD